jgi:hypothetical protein
MSDVCISATLQYTYGSTRLIDSLLIDAAAVSVVLVSVECLFTACSAMTIASPPEA